MMMIKPLFFKGFFFFFFGWHCLALASYLFLILSLKDGGKRQKKWKRFMSNALKGLSQSSRSVK